MLPRPRSAAVLATAPRDRKSTRLNSSHLGISYAVFCLKKKKKKREDTSQEHANHRGVYALDAKTSQEARRTEAIREQHVCIKPKGAQDKVTKRAARVEG